MDFTWLMWNFLIPYKYWSFSSASYEAQMGLWCFLKEWQPEVPVKMPFFFLCSQEIASYFKHELPNLAALESSSVSGVLPPARPVEWCTGQWHQYFQLILGCTGMLKEKAPQDTSAPFCGLSLASQPAPAAAGGCWTSQRHGWRCWAVQQRPSPNSQLLTALEGRHEPKSI